MYNSKQTELEHRVLGCKFWQTMCGVYSEYYAKNDVFDTYKKRNLFYRCQ